MPGSESAAAHQPFYRVLQLWWTATISTLEPEQCAAVFCGIFKDAAGAAPFGTYILVYIAASYITTLVRRYVYEPGSRFSRLVVVLMVVVGCFIVQATLSNMNHEVLLSQLLLYVMVPQLLTTMVAATWIFAQLRALSVFLKLKNAS